MKNCKGCDGMDPELLEVKPIKSTDAATGAFIGTFQAVFYHGALAWVDPVFGDTEKEAFDKFKAKANGYAGMTDPISAVSVHAFAVAHLLWLIIYRMNSEGKDTEVSRIPLGPYSGRDDATFKMRLLNGRVHYVDYDEKENRIPE